MNVPDRTQPQASTGAVVPDRDASGIVPWCESYYPPSTFFAPAFVPSVTFTPNRRITLLIFTSYHRALAKEERNVRTPHRAAARETYQ